MPRVTISLVTWNGEKDIEGCIQSLLNQAFRDFEIIVLDNGSKDNTLKKIRAVRAGVPLRVIELRENIGFAAGHNRVIRESSGEFVCTLNQDVRLENGYLERLLAFMEKHTRSGAVAGILYRSRASTENDASDELHTTRFIDTAGLRIRRSLRAVEVQGAVLPLHKANEVFGVSAAAAMYRRTSLQDIALPRASGGGEEYFDEDFFSYKEDVDLAWRLRLRGWEAWTVPDAEGVHTRSAGANGNGLLSARRARASFSLLARKYSLRNQLLLLVKSVPRVVLMRSGIFVLFIESAKVWYTIFSDPAAARALFEIPRLLPVMRRKRAYIMKRSTAEYTALARWIGA